MLKKRILTPLSTGLGAVGGSAAGRQLVIRLVEKLVLLTNINLTEAVTPKPL